MWDTPCGSSIQQHFWLIFDSLAYVLARVCVLCTLAMKRERETERVVNIQILGNCYVLPGFED